MFFVEGWWRRVNERLVNQAKCGVVLFLLLLLFVEVLFARTLIVIEQAQLPFLDPASVVNTLQTPYEASHKQLCGLGTF